ncbi:hypothetical protein FHW67_003723 [Herbaspirillum sp. Sphag1AN]|uniref:ApeA N-terminal domain 1-containing protein n=1 Tax=unclassified Herbaspirillum TaxID=2624150 RepID=UPI001607A00D|nr:MULTISPECIES: hypothetical protein [unclassified Herbaspirillum]MBB3214406.1 hypothetical protein [Herbaspirillum sp. Sphag1AN]MBB3247490.1 hypothetical protein [Herbaspirillum sp. Sphag64]
MSTDEFNHFESYEWLGLFNYPDKSIDFPGKLTYTPDKGLQLEFMCQMDSNAKKVGHLHGVLSSGRLCTLVGNFDPPSYGMSIGSVSIYRGKPRFEYAIFGVHADPSEKFRGILMDFPNFQEFFHPQGFQDSAEYSNEPLHVHSGDGLEVSVITSGKFFPVFSDFANRFQSEDPEVLQEIEEFFADLAKRHPAGKISSRVEMKWLLEC